MHNPAHPGEILLELYLKPLGVSITAAADALGLTRKHVSEIIHGHAPVSADMAIRLAAALGNIARARGMPVTVHTNGTLACGYAVAYEVMMQ